MQKRIIAISILLFVILTSAFCTCHATTDLTLNNTPAQVYFSPRGGCTEAIIKQIDQAKSEILVQAYSFTSAPIAKA